MTERERSKTSHHATGWMDLFKRNESGSHRNVTSCDERSKRSFYVYQISTLYSLKRVAFEEVATHLRRNAGVTISYTGLPWYYLTGFYSKTPGSGSATRSLRSAIAAIGEPIILCCEPVLGTDPRSLTPRNADMDSDSRYEALCNYYRRHFNLCCETPTHCTLRTELTGYGTRNERIFMWSPSQPLLGQPMMPLV
jgi:hypothetical protein